MNGSMLTAQTDLPRRNGGAEMYRVPEIFPTRPRRPNFWGDRRKIPLILDTRNSGYLPRRFDGPGTYGIFTHVDLRSERGLSQI